MDTSRYDSVFIGIELKNEIYLLCVVIGLKECFTFADFPYLHTGTLIPYEKGHHL